MLVGVPGMVSGDTYKSISNIPRNLKRVDMSINSLESLNLSIILYDRYVMSSKCHPGEAEPPVEAS